MIIAVELSLAEKEFESVVAAIVQRRVVRLEKMVMEIMIKHCPAEQLT